VDASEGALLTVEPDDGPIYLVGDVVVLTDWLNSCGLGFEITLLLPPLIWLRRRRAATL
jgi:hypothetical protein